MVRARRHAQVLRSTLLFLLACALSYGLEHLASDLIAQHDGSGATHSVFSARNVYQYLVAAWPRRLVPRYTALVSIDPENDPVAEGLAHNLCAQRRFIARLLPAIAQHEPALIVVDKYFTAGGCTDPAPTRALQQAVEQVGARMPLVLGVRIRDDGTPPGRGPPGVVPPLAFDGAARLHEGSVNLDLDARRIPLGWTVQRVAGAAPQWLNGLALEAAQVHDPKLREKYPLLDRLVERRTNPYLSLIAPSDLVVFQAADLLCRGADAPAACAGRGGADPGYLRGRAVILGEASRDLDLHDSIVGPVQGMVLQANYLEALLDQRYFAPVPPWVDFAVGFLVFLAIEASLRHRSAIVSLLRVLGVLLLTFVLLSLAVRYLGYYVNPVTVSLLVLTVKLIGWLGERIAGIGGPHHAS